jgi:chorismate synthase
MDIRDLHTLEDYSLVVDLQRRVWGDGYDDVVPLSILAVVVKRGGILVGAFDGATLAAFVFSVPGLKDRLPMQWSHMLGVDEAYRRSGIGYTLKLAQRDRALAQGLDLVEWTYDPLMAPNAHLNFARLGVVAEEYLENVYGASGSVLHQGAPTDRFIAAWNIATPHVERRIARDAQARAASSIGVVRDASVAEAPVLNATREERGWLVPVGDPDLGRDEARLLVTIPARYGDMLQQEPAAALAWRLQTRSIFQTYFARGYRCVDFLLNREQGRGQYVMEQKSAASL